MPGLDPVVQKVGADGSEYISEYQKMLKAAREFSEANKELIRVVQDADRVLGKAASEGAAAWQRQAESLDRYSAMMREAAKANEQFNATQIQTERLTGDGRKALQSLSDEYRRYSQTSAEARKAQAMFRDGLIDQANSSQGAIVAMSEHEQAVARLAKTYGTAQEAFAKSDFSTPLKYTVDNVSALNDALASTMVHADGVTRALSETDKIRARIMAGSGGYGGAQPSVYYNPFTGGGGGGGLWPAVAQFAGAGGGGGGGGGGGWAAAAAAAAGGPFDKGTAGSMWAPVGTFLGTWLPRAHYVLMAANELAATVGPATIAAGMGALVGMQGGEQAIPRLKAVFSTAESLGGSLNTTAGQYMGLRTPALQNAQDLATGAAFEGIGALTNIMRAGGGSPFIQLGSNTVAMWSRMMANLTDEFQKGLGNQLGGLVTGGTDYLAQFGHIFGNIGHLFLNVAPNLPGVGGDYLSILQGITGGLARGTGALGPAIGPLLAMEAGGRLGTPLVGGVGALLGRLGTGAAGLADTLGATSLSGLSAADIAAVAGETGVGLTTGGGLLARLLGRGGVGLAKAGGFLGALGAPEIAGLAAAAFGISKGFTYQTPMQQTVSGMLGGVNQMGIPQALPSIIQDMQKLAAVPYSAAPGRGAGANFLQALGKDTGIGQGFNIGGGFAQGWHSLLQAVGIKGTDPNNYQAAQSGLQQLAQGFVNVLNTGGQVQQQWKSLGGGALSMGKAFDVATMAQLQLGSAFYQTGKHAGQLTTQAKTMIANLYAGYQPMNMNTGQFGAAVGAQTAMAGLQHTQVGAVNQSYDQLMQLVQGGAAGSAAYAGLLRAMPGGSGAAMRGFLSPRAAAAWTAFASTSQPSVVSQLQSQTDWLRNAQTMGVLGAGQTAGMAEFLLGKALPSAKGSPAALAMLSTVAQQFGGPAFAPGTSAATMYKQLQAFAGHGVGAGGYNQLMTRGTEGLANIGRDAQQFTQQLGQGIGGAMASAIADRGGTLMQHFMMVAGHAGTSQALGGLTNFLAGSGTPLKGAEQMISYAAKLSGAGPQQINQMMAQVKKQYDIYIREHADASGLAKVRADINALKDKQLHEKVNVEGASQLKTLENEIKALSSKQVRAAAQVQGAAAVRALNAEIAALHSKEVTITTRLITVGGAIAGFPGIPQGVINPHYNPGAFLKRQTGGLVPGSGAGDIIPAMLEPGEIVVPRYLAPLIAPIMAAHRVPGFGGMPQSAASHFAMGGIVPHVLGFPDPGTAGSIGGLPLAQIAARSQDFAFTLIDSLTRALKAAGARKIATELVDQITKELKYAKGAAQAALYGQGYDPSGKSAGIFGNMDVTPGTGGGTVQEQMQSYLHSVQSFTKDIAALRKGHLNKAVIAQLIAAGPVQGDALAQSIMNDYGGIKGVNKLWKQLGSASHALGGQEAASQFAGLSPNLHSATVNQNNVHITVNAKGSGGLNLTPADIKRLVAEIQAELLKQAKRNPRTGLQLTGKGA